MNTQSLEEAVRQCYLEENTNCAETLLKACNRVYGLGLPEASIRLMSGFGGGLQTGSLCGALAGCTAALSYMLVETRAHDCPDLRQGEQLLIRHFRQQLGDTHCVKIKPVHHHPETRCLQTCLRSARAMEKTVQELAEQGKLELGRFAPL